jgi:TPR repeat protein
MYPEDSIANLNAANVAMIKKDYEKAIQHLDKAGQEPVVKYLRGVVEVLREDYKAARPYLEEAAANGVEEAQETLDNMIRHWTVIVDNDEILKTYKENQK